MERGQKWMPSGINTAQRSNHPAILTSSWPSIGETNTDELLKVKFKIKRFT
jgi:hypothetical protein